jgi:hypothetical protein
MEEKRDESTRNQRSSGLLGEKGTTTTQGMLLPRTGTRKVREELVVLSLFPSIGEQGMNDQEMLLPTREQEVRLVT